eukprot:13281234-Alexandrium_andersonii.AAC.1
MGCQAGAGSPRQGAKEPRTNEANDHSHLSTRPVASMRCAVVPFSLGACGSYVRCDVAQRGAREARSMSVAMAALRKMQK